MARRSGPYPLGTPYPSRAPGARRQRRAAIWPHTEWGNTSSAGTPVRNARGSRPETDMAGVVSDARAAPRRDGEETDDAARDRAGERGAEVRDGVWGPEDRTRSGIVVATNVPPRSRASRNPSARSWSNASDTVVREIRSSLASNRVEGSCERAARRPERMASRMSAYT